MLLMLMTALFAFVCIVALLLFAGNAYRRACIVLRMRNIKPGLRSFALLLLESGVPDLDPLAERLLQKRRLNSLMEKAVEIACDRNASASAQSLLTLFMAFVFAVFIAILMGTQNLIAAIAVVVCIGATAILGVGSAFDKLQNEFREDIPVVLELMTTCSSSGFTLLQTFEQIAHDMNGRFGQIFAQSAHVLQTGGSVADAMDVLRRHADASELTFIVAALEVQHKNGGALAPALSSAAESVKNELALKQTLRVQTAQARLSARVVIIMPFILIALFSLISPDFLSPFFSSLIGFVLFVLAILMEMAGIVLVRRSLSIGGLA